MIDERHNRYYLAIGRAVDYNDKVVRDFTLNYFSLVPSGYRLDWRAGMVSGRTRAGPG